MLILLELTSSCIIFLFFTQIKPFSFIVNSLPFSLFFSSFSFSFSPHQMISSFPFCPGGLLPESAYKSVQVFRNYRVLLPFLWYAMLCQNRDHLLLYLCAILKERGCRFPAPKFLADEKKKMKKSGCFTTLVLHLEAPSSKEWI